MWDLQRRQARFALGEFTGQLSLADPKSGMDLRWGARTLGTIFQLVVAEHSWPDLAEYYVRQQDLVLSFAEEK